MSIAVHAAPTHPRDAQLLPVKPDLDQKIFATVVLRGRTSDEDRLAAVKKMSAQLPHQRRYLNLDELVHLHGATAEDLQKVEAFAQKHRLHVVESSAARRSVVLSGALANFREAFQVNFVHFHSPRGEYRSYQGPLLVADELRGIIKTVLGFDERPLLRTQSNPAPAPILSTAEPRHVAQIYDFPANASAHHQTIGIFEFGGGFNHSDVVAYLAKRGTSNPKITVVEVDGQKNSPTDSVSIRNFVKAAESMGFGAPDGPPRSPAANPGPVATARSASASAGPAGRANAGAGSAAAPARTPSNLEEVWWTMETTMNVELIGALATGASLVVYFAPDTPQGKYDMLMTALTDSKNAPSVISCSWGDYESNLSPELMQVLDEACQLAALKGVTLCYASGDFGDGSSENQGKTEVMFPASSPHVLGCGGTQLNINSSPIEESAWDQSLGGTVLQSGGGVSGFFSNEPDWQVSARVTQKTGRKGRGVPDVAAKADFSPGYSMLINQVEAPLGGGTSAAAPLWAGLVAVMNEALGTPVGFLNPLLYTQEFRAAFREIVDGKIGVNRASLGWDACTGWGSPKGSKLLAALGGKKP
jgi:kumamolisin